MKKIFLICFILSFLLFLRFFFAYHFRHVYKDREQVRWSTLLLNDIDRDSNSVRLTILLPNTFPPQRVTIVFPGSSGIHFGQNVVISGTLSQKVLENNNIANTIYFPTFEVDQSIADYPLKSLYYIREKILALFQMTLSDIDSSLLLGIVFGIKAHMSKTFSQELQATGVTHVIAASGMNVTMVAGFLIWVFGKYFPRKIAISLSILGLGIYAVFSGLQASIVRATIMGICVFSAQLFGRQYHSIYILCLTACIMLFLSPQALFDIGFQLSFLSTLGIIMIQPLLPQKNIFSEDLATTVAAQIATVPVLLVAFGQYSLLSVLVNGLVLWTIPPLMILGSCAAGFGLIAPVIGTLFLYLALPLLWFFEKVVGFFASLPGVVHITLGSPFIIIGYYLVVGAIAMIVHELRVKSHEVSKNKKLEEVL